ncbi:uncharacterized protein BJ171DRAFT_510449 [Polychytrium aggregatum]|uniref:uncharacterized protein n=1 Tax=Polychytrium aggregatum TaxID=110093 RepID=UPI0022FEDA16|nr:uncharacterized protein BJ171DRAFT_510449 [Polychytrium aggregatum]KAI9203352.1 hypothetical protein BJ171DRAFT_510449 [Polychytrium aggregatum]
MLIPARKRSLCDTHGERHDYFFGYRSSSDLDTARGLKRLVVSVFYRRYGEHLAVFLDRDCLSDADSWQRVFLEELPNSSVAVFLISKESMDIMQQNVETNKEDGVVLEIERALQLRDSGSDLRILPLSIATYDGTSYTIFHPYNYAFPASPRFDRLRHIFHQLKQIQMLTLRPDQAHRRVYRLLNLLRPISSATKDVLDQLLKRHFCDAKFFGHIDHLDSLLEQVTRTGRAIISGLGGMGKSVLARQFLRYMMGTLEVSNQDSLVEFMDSTIGTRPQYFKFYWINCATEATALDGLIKLFPSINIEEIKQHASHYFANQHGYLLVLDNIDDIDAVNSVFEHSETLGFGGDVIVTTRLSSISTGAFLSAFRAKVSDFQQQPIRLLPWSDDLTYSYIFQKCKILSERITLETSVTRLRNIVTKLEGNPLTIQSFMLYYEAEEPALNELGYAFDQVFEQKHGPNETQRSLRVLVSLAMEFIRSHGDEGLAACKLYGGLCLLGSEDIPFDLIKQVAGTLGLVPRVSSTLRKLVQIGLLRQSADDYYYTSALQQRAAREYLEGRPDLDLTSISDAVGRAFVSKIQFPCDRPTFSLSHHFDQYLQLSFDHCRNHPLSFEVEITAAKLDIERGRFKAASDRLTRLCDIEDDLNTLEAQRRYVSIRLYLAQSCTELRQFDSAHRALQEALAFFQSPVTSDERETQALLVAQQGRTYLKAGCFSEAAGALERSIQIISSVRDSFYYQDVASALILLGDIAKAEKRPKDALTHYNRVLEIEPNISQIHDQSYLADIHVNIAVISSANNKLDTAHKHFQSSIAVRTQLLGTSVHPKVASAHLQYADWLFRIGYFTEALDNYNRAFAIFTQVFETCCLPETAYICSRRSLVLMKSGAPKSAIDAIQEALKLAQKVYGPSLRDAEIDTLKSDARNALSSLGGSFEAAFKSYLEAFLLYPNVCGHTEASDDTAQL